MGKMGARSRGRGKTKTGKSRMKGGKVLAIAARKARLEQLYNSTE